MTQEQWSRVEAYFDSLRGLPLVEIQAALAAIADADIRTEVASLLESVGDGAMLAGVVGGMAARMTSRTDRSSLTMHDERIGPYRLVRRIGQGGMGTVYEASRVDDFHKQVALKVVKLEFDSDFARARFQQERQLLASLEHPYIARLLDGGESEAGNPYLVLEFVQGQPIDEYCAGLDRPSQLRLFLKVCEAVEHAHRNLVVHRDLKPANILVTAEGNPKLLDFGIAKLVDPTATVTQTGMAAMTPDYASPEQVRGLPISTASDVYSLGVILYHLLTGSKPYTLDSITPFEMDRVICQTPPAPPRLGDELDHILLMALRKEPERRYGSVRQFAEDIERYLDDQPVRARPDTLRYRSAKFVRRNRLGLTAAAAVTLALAGGVVASQYQARRAERRFSQVRELANAFLFQFYDQVTPLPGSTAVRASIVETARKYLDALASEAGNDQGLLFELAQAYQRLGEVQGSRSAASLGQVDNARRSFQHSLDLYGQLGVNANSPVRWRRGAVRTLLSWCVMEYDGNRVDAAEPLAQRALALTEQTPQDPEIAIARARAERDMGEVRLLQGHAPEALAFFASGTKRLFDLRAAGGGDADLPADLQILQDRAARTKVRMGDLDGAITTFQELVRNSPPCDEGAPRRLECRTLAIRLSWTADVYGALDRPNLEQPEKAAPLYERSMHILERLAAQDAADREIRFDLAARYGKLGDAVWKSDPQRALKLYEQAVGTARALVSKEQVNQIRGSYLDAISRPLILLGRTVEARRALTEAIELAGPPVAYADRLGDLDVRILSARLLATEGKREEAERSLEAAIRIGDGLRAGHPKDLSAIFFLSSVYRELASITTGERKRRAFLQSAAVWHAWPATTYTAREEANDLDASKR